MSGSILVGCRGWKHRVWTPEFYPEELPDEWRFCYYSNEIRSLLVPYDDVCNENPERWREDCDEEFRFVFEFEVGAGVTGETIERLERLQARIRPVADRTAAILLSATRRLMLSSGDLMRLLETSTGFPLSVDLSRARNKEELETLLERSAVGRVWHPMCDPATPVAGFQISLVEHAEVRLLRSILESLRPHAEGGRGAALFFTQPETAPELARQARALAELMGI